MATLLNGGSSSFLFFEGGGVGVNTYVPSSFETSTNGFSNHSYFLETVYGCDEEVACCLVTKLSCKAGLFLKIPQMYTIISYGMNVIF